MQLAVDVPHWALRHALAFLTRRDVARLVVAALEQPTSDSATLAQWLLSGDACAWVLNEVHVIHYAVAEGCWRAALALLEAYRLERQFLTTAKKKRSDLLAVDASPFERVVALLDTVPFVFPAEVVYAAAARGDLRAVEWLHAAGGYSVQEAMRSAARARQFHVLEWLMRASRDDIVAGLRLADSGSLKAVCWYHRDCFTRKIILCAATMNSGYAETHTFVDQRTTHSDFEYYPLADLFAEAGDLESLQSVAGLANSSKYFTRETILKASAAGHLQVVQWLISLDVRKWNLLEAASKAAMNGHLALLQWLYQFAETHESSVLFGAIKEGHEEMCRWIWQQQQDKPINNFLQSFPLSRAAAMSRNPKMLTFVHDEYGIEFSPFVLTSLAENATRQHVAYVLGKMGTARGDRLEQLLLNVARDGSRDALIYLVDDSLLWSRGLLIQATKSFIDALEKVKFVAARAVSRAEKQLLQLSECLDVDVENLLEMALSERYDVAIWLLRNLPGPDDGGTQKAACDPNFVPPLTDDLISSSTNAMPSPLEIEDVLLTYMDSRPSASRTIKWLPQLAVYANSLKAFKRLHRLGHPEIKSTDTRDAITKLSRDPRFMLEFLMMNPSIDCNHKVVEWATKHSFKAVLTLVCGRAVSADQRGQVLRKVARCAATTGNLEMLDWVWQTDSAQFVAEPEAIVVGIFRTITAHHKAQKWLNDRRLTRVSL